jgi:hypothetical protein
MILSWENRLSGVEERMSKAKVAVNDDATSTTFTSEDECSVTAFLEPNYPQASANIISLASPHQ